MQDNLKRLCSPLSLFGISLFVITMITNKQVDFFIYLTAAQLLFVPLLLQCIVELKTFEKVILAIGMLGVTVVAFNINEVLSITGAGLYLVATAMISWIGMRRFLQRGFTNTAEIVIDIGLMYLVIGGVWFFAYIAGIDTGFTPLITWLTSIHFHYSAFLFCISLGLIGRVTTSKLYKPIVVVIASGPILMAIGITLSTAIEIISAILYIIAIYILFFVTLRTKYYRLQGVMIRLSIAAVCFSILWSFLYAYGNFTRQSIVDIPDMLAFHGFTNCLFFGGFTIVGWLIYTPATNQNSFTFPISQIRGQLKTKNEPYPGLVDDMSEFVSTDQLHKAITHFYEHTNEYRLFARVRWQLWFWPFAFFYKGISRLTQQINLPLSNQKTEMTGKIVTVDATIDGREKPRAWIRTIDEKTVFTAIYSKHTADHTYMNIALPLPFSTMIGILYLHVEDDKLHLTTQAAGDSGIYLAFSKYLFKLPLTEHFTIQATTETELTALHEMKIFGLKFLKIEYDIQKVTTFES
ncbi:YndJ family protein [Solibacillus sp. CAU 1738]|uniref:YndJ family protein n=1 Tax=Solibacillus sp. CAU 1738 TaxID=3140363 RepID=UPI003260D2D2